MQQSTGAIRPAPIRSRFAGWSVQRLMSQLPIIFFIISAALFIGSLAAAIVPQRFAASATFVLDDGRGAASPFDTPNDAAAIMATPDFAREVVSRLGASSDEMLAPPILPAIIADWMASYGWGAHAPEQPTEADLIRAYLDALSSTPTHDGRALNITFYANKPEVAARAANTTAQVYLERRNVAVKERNLALNTTEQRVQQAQASLQQALEKERMFRTNPAGPETARQARKASDDLALLIAERAALVVERDAISRRLASVEAAIGADNQFLAPFEGVSLLRHLVEQRLSLRAEIAAERRIREARDWRIRVLSARANAVDGQIIEASGVARDWLTRERDHLAKRIGELEGAIRLRQAIIAAAADNSERQQALVQAVESARLELSLEREILGDEMMRFQAGAASAYVMRPAETPRVPDRTWPSIIGGITALLIIASLLWLKSCMQGVDRADGVWSQAEEEPVSTPVVPFDGLREAKEPMAEATGEAPVSAGSSVPQVSSVTAPPSVAPQVPFAVVQMDRERDGALDAIFNRLAIAPRTDGAAHLIVVGADGQAEAFSLAQALARHRAMRERVILLDLSQSGQSEGLQPPGLTDLIAGRASFAEIITRDSGARLHQVTRGSSEVGADQMVDAVELAMAALDQTYDWIVQSAAMEEKDELVQGALKRADGVVLAAQGEAVDVKTLAAYETLREKGLENIVVALVE